MPTIEYAPLTGGLPYTKERSTDAVDVTSIAFDRMSQKWSMIHDLLGGTAAMRRAATTWLPREPREELAKYELRLSRSYLYNAFGDTIKRLVSKPFSKSIGIVGEIPQPLREIEDNVDLGGRNLTQFCREVFTSGITYGLTHVLVDHPAMSGDETKAEEIEYGARPVFIHCPAPSVIAWKTEDSYNGAVLTEVRIKEYKVEPVGKFSEEEFEYVRVYRRDSWELWRKAHDQEEFAMVSSGANSLGVVPLITYYANRTDFMTGDPPLEDLAWMNLAHWQSMSDQRNILRFARTGMLFGSGFTDEEKEQGITVGPNQFIASESPDAKLSYIEHSGKAIGAGADDLRALEERMEVLGMQPLVQRSGTQTATGKVIDEARVYTDIQAWIRSLEDFVIKLYGLAGMWRGVDIPEDVQIDITNDFGLSLRSADDVKAIIESRQSGELSRETFLREMRRRGLLSETLDIEEEIDKIESESASMVTEGLEDEPEELPKEEKEEEEEEK